MTVSSRFSRQRRVHYLVLLLLTLFIASYLTSNASALSPAQIQLFQSGIPYFDANGSSTSGTTSCGGSSTTTTPATTTGSAGTGLPDGAAFPDLDPASMATAINSWVTEQNPNSQLAGLGSTIVNDAQNSNVNPFLIVAIAREESNMSDPSDYNVMNANNSFGREATASQPNYPGAGPNAGTLWYKWSSVEASVDYTAPENQNASGGGDMAAYLRDQYGSQLDTNNLTAMFMLYAPPGANNTAQYIANVQSWVTELVNLTNNPSASTTTSTSTSSVSGSSDCSSTTTSTCQNGPTTSAGPNAAILCEAEKYSGIYYLWGGGHNYAAFRAQCPETSLATAAASSTSADPGPCATDCSGLVSMAVDGAYNQDFNWSVSDSTGQMVGGGAQYWQSIPISQAEAGDIVTTTVPDGHVEIVESVQGNTVNTFGSHYTGTETGSATSTPSFWVTGAWRWTGPGSSS